MTTAFAQVKSRLDGLSVEPKRSRRGSRGGENEHSALGTPELARFHASKWNSGVIEWESGIGVSERLVDNELIE